MPPGTAKPTPFSAFSPFPPPVWHLAAEPLAAAGARGAGEGLPSLGSPPRPPVPRLVAGRRAACSWQGSVSCGRIPVPRSLPISLRAGTAGGSGDTGGEGWGGWIVKGREGKEEKKKKKWTHAIAGAARLPKRQQAVGAKTHRRRRGGSGSTSRRGHMEDGQRGGGMAWPRQDEQQPQEPERREVFAFVVQGVRVRACVCAGLCIPSLQAARGLPACPSISCLACPAISRLACPAVLPCLPGTGSHRLQVLAGLALGLQGGFATRGAGRRG